MDYGYSVNGWRPLSAPPVPYDPETVAADLATAGYAVHPVGSTLDGAVVYLDADAPTFPYVIDITEIAGTTTLVWVHDLVALTKLSGELGTLKTMLGIS